MDTDVAICEILKVQLDVADIDTAKGEKMPDGGTTSVLQFIFKQAEAKKEKSKIISPSARSVKTGKSVSLYVFLFCFECMVMFRNGILPTSKMYVFLD